jgi:hypothetical protein
VLTQFRCYSSNSRNAALMVNWMIDLGPDAGEIMVTGTPEEVAAHPTSHTGRYLKQVLEQHPPSQEAAQELGLAWELALGH